MERDISCVICSSKVSPAPGNYHRDYFHPQNPKLLSQDLGNYFLLRHIFNFSSDQLENYLRCCPSPRDWVKVCSGCTENYVDPGTRLFLELLEVTRKFRAVRNEIVEAVKKSTENEPPIPVETFYALDITKDVRRLVSQAESDNEVEIGWSNAEVTKGAFEHSPRPWILADCLQDKEDADANEDVFGDQTEDPFSPGTEEDPVDEIKVNDLGAWNANAEIKVKQEDEISEKEEKMKDETQHVYSADLNIPEGDSDNGNFPIQTSTPKTPTRSTRVKLSQIPARRTTRKRTKCRPINNSQLHCKYCRKVFLFQTTLIKHQETCSKSPAAPSKIAVPTLRCDLCGVLVSSPKMLDHVRGHVGDFAIKCPNDPCPYAYSNSRRLPNHLNYQCKFNPNKMKTTTQPEKTGENDGENANKPHLKKRPPTHNYLYTCETCGFESYKRTTFQSHLEVTHERASNKNYSCPLVPCQESFSVRQSVDFHLSTHRFRETDRQTCGECQKKVTVTEMKEHLTGVHGSGEIFPCPHCPFLFSRKAAMIEHLFIHRHLGLSCDICGSHVKFLQHWELRKHHATEHHLEFSQHTCHVCGKMTSRRDRLQRHIQKEHAVAGQGAAESVPTPAAAADNTPAQENSPGEPRSYKRFSCDLCVDSPILYYQRTLFTHKVKVHGWEPLQCKTCGKQYKSLTGLELHERSEHVGIMERVCPVPGCGKVFNTESKLKSHSRCVHPNKMHCCSQCDSKFPNVTKLRSHENAVHFGIKPHVCETCGKCFGSLNRLKGHSTMHTGEQPYQCGICGRKFRERKSLARHAKVHAKKGKSDR